MLVQAGGGGGEKPFRPDNNKVIDKVMLDTNSNNITSALISNSYSDRDCEPKKNGTLRVTFSEASGRDTADYDFNQNHANNNHHHHQQQQYSQQPVSSQVTSYSLPTNYHIPSRTGVAGHHIHTDITSPLTSYRSIVTRPEYEGWDNPFRDEGEVSRDADRILRLWKEGRLTGNLQDLLRGAGASPCHRTSSPASSTTGQQQQQQERQQEEERTSTNDHVSRLQNGHQREPPAPQHQSGGISQGSTPAAVGSGEPHETKANKKNSAGCCSVM